MESTTEPAAYFWPSSVSVTVPEAEVALPLSFQLASVKAALPDLEAQRLQAIHRIGVLLGEEPAALMEQLEEPHPRLHVPLAPRAVPGQQVPMKLDHVCRVGKGARAPVVRVTCKLDCARRAHAVGC